MENKLTTPARLLMALIALLGWFAVITQFYLHFNNRSTPVPEMIVRFFSYFTIQNNLLVATCYTCLLLQPSSAAGRFFSRQQTLAAVTVYILIVGLIYNVILRFIWDPKGLQAVVDELLHSVVPVLAIIWWLLFAPKNRLQWKDAFPWLIYPFAYIMVVLIRGSSSGFYPYPFINTAQLGLNKVLVNAVGIAILFLIISLVFVAVSKAISKNALPSA
jgi:hypothetical protein